jgi:hypothetical protein
MPLGGAVLVAQWSADTNTPYTVNYKFQNIDDNEYTLS